MCSGPRWLFNTSNLDSELDLAPMAQRDPGRCGGGGHEGGQTDRGKPQQIILGEGILVEALDFQVVPGLCMLGIQGDLRVPHWLQCFLDDLGLSLRPVALEHQVGV